MLTNSLKRHIEKLVEQAEKNMRECVLKQLDDYNSPQIKIPIAGEVIKPTHKKPKK